MKHADASAARHRRYKRFGFGLISPQGKPRELLSMARIGRINLTVSEFILYEVSDVLLRKFEWTHAEIEEALHWLSEIVRKVSAAVSLDVIKEDPSDNRILECAVSAGSDYIVTGDNDLLRLKQYDGIRIVKAAELLLIAQATTG